MSIKYEDLCENLGCTPGQLVLHNKHGGDIHGGSQAVLFLGKRQIASFCYAQFPSCCGSFTVSYLDVSRPYQRKGVGTFMCEVMKAYSYASGSRNIVGISRTDDEQEDFWRSTFFDVSPRWRNYNSDNDLISLNAVLDRRPRNWKLFRRPGNAQHIHYYFGGTMSIDSKEESAFEYR